MVGADLGGPVEPERGQPGEHLALVGDRRRVHDVVGGDAVGRDQQQAIVARLVDVADLPLGDERGGFAHPREAISGRSRSPGARIPQRAGCCAAHTRALGGDDARHDRQRGDERAGAHVLAEQRRRPARASAAAGRAGPDRSSPRRRARAPRTRRRRRGTCSRARRRRSRARRRPGRRRRRPAPPPAPIGSVSGSDSTSAQQITRLPPMSRASAAALGVADRAERDRAEHEQVGAADAGALRGREREHGAPARPRWPPRTRAEGRSPARATAITAVAAGSRPTITALWRRGQLAQRERGQQREAEDHAERHEREPRERRRGRAAAHARAPAAAPRAARRRPRGRGRRRRGRARRPRRAWPAA